MPSYLRLQKEWRERLAKEARCLVVQVETEVVVPVELASNKREHAARTLRPRMREHLDDFLVELEPTALDKRSLDIETSGLDLSDIGAILDGMELDRTVPPVSHLQGGTSRRSVSWSSSSRRGSTPTWSTATSPRATTSRT